MSKPSLDSVLSANPGFPKVVEIAPDHFVNSANASRIICASSGASGQQRRWYLRTQADVDSNEDMDLETRNRFVQALPSTASSITQFGRREQEWRHGEGPRIVYI